MNQLTTCDHETFHLLQIICDVCDDKITLLKILFLNNELRQKLNCLHFGHDYFNLTDWHVDGLQVDTLEGTAERRWLVLTPNLLAGLVPVYVSVDELVDTYQDRPGSIVLKFDRFVLKTSRKAVVKGFRPYAVTRDVLDTIQVEIGKAIEGVPWLNDRIASGYVKIYDKYNSDFPFMLCNLSDLDYRIDVCEVEKKCETDYYPLNAWHIISTNLTIRFKEIVADPANYDMNGVLRRL